MPKKETHVEIAIELLKVSKKSMHINDIAETVSAVKGYRIARTSIQSAMTKYMNKYGVLRKPRPGYFALVK